MTDLLGVRIITYFPDEVDKAAKLVEREFCVDPDNSVDKRSILDPDRFGYLSLHYVLTLNRSVQSWPNIKTIRGKNLNCKLDLYCSMLGPKLNTT